MLQQFTDELRIPTRGRGFTELTRELSAFVHASGVRTGLLTVLLKHTSASLLIQENADPDVRADFERFFKRLVPDGDPLFQHDSEGPDDMPAHIRTALTTVHLSVPVVDGRLALGTWQGVYVWEHRTSPHHRRVALHLIGEA
ncbi:MAG: secondary thiamine-phosphate synthase enzyme YjbQ [Limisphaerales bacterium]